MKKLYKNAHINGKRQNLLVENGYISYVGEDTPQADEGVDVGGKTLIPAMIDPHVHVRDLGQTEKEDWTSASRAARKGGVAMIFDMPNNKPPTVNLTNLNLKRKVAEKSVVDYKFNIAVTGWNLKEAEEILKQKPADVAALKLFLAGSSNNEYVENIGDIKRIFELSLRYDLPVIIHTELQKCIEKYASQVSNSTIFEHNFIRNRECAVRGTELVIELAKETGNAVYIAHTSTAEEIELIRKNKHKTRIFCEITPHHLLLNESVLESAGNFAKVNPPIRTEADNRALWQGIADGTVDVIGTDHAPHTLAEKNRDYALAPSGFPGLETALPLLLNEVRKGNLTLDRLVELTSTRATEIFKIPERGKIATGYHADLVAFDWNDTETVRADEFETKAKYSPFEGMEVIRVESL